MLAFAALPGMPTLVFFGIALGTFSLGLYLLLRSSKVEELQPVQVEQMAPEQNGEEDLRVFEPSRPYLLQFASAHQHQERTTRLIHGIRQVRNSIVTTAGLTLPSFEIEYSALLAEDEFRFCVHEGPVLKATFGDWLAVARDSVDPHPQSAFRGSEQRDELEWLWLPPDDPLLAREEVRSFSAHALILERMRQAMMISGPRFLGIQECKSILGWLEQSQPELVQELQRIMPLSRLSGVLQRLASEGVPLRAIRLIVEVLTEHGQHEREVIALADYVRIALRSQIYHLYSQNDGLHAWLFSPHTENIFREALRQTQSGVFFALDNEHSTQLVQLLKEAFGSRTREKSVLLVAHDLRSPLRTLLFDEFNHVPVISFAELTGSAKVRVQGRFDLEYEGLLREVES